MSRVACLRIACLAAVCFSGGLSFEARGNGSMPRPVPPTAAPADSLIRPGEDHFAHLWQLTFGGENAEGYWSGSGEKITFQSTRDGYPCDRQYVLDMKSGDVTLVSTGTGRVTCGYFYDDDRRILFSSTHLASDSCPPPPDMSQGYVWALYPGYDIVTVKAGGSDLKRLTETPGYDAEATLSVDGKWIVFTSVRDGDIDLYRMRPDGSDIKRLTSEIGYDGGAFFSRDGEWICWRRNEVPTDSSRAVYTGLLSRNLVKPTQMNIWVMRSDGSDKRQVTFKPGASFAPYFTPDGKSILYASNWESPRSRNFDLYLVSLAGGDPVPVTRDPDFDSFPMFSPDGKWLVFASNRGQMKRGETNLFLAEWK